MAIVRLAIPVVASSLWQGGFNYLFNIARVLSIYMSKYIKIVACFGSDIPERDKLKFQEIPNIEIIVDDAFSAKNNYLKFFFIFFFGIDKKAIKAFEANDINAVLEPARFFGRNCSLPVLAWIPDFQHKHSPENFSLIARLKRETGFTAQMRNNRTLLLSSDTSHKDLINFYPRFKGKVLINKFPVIFSEAELSMNVDELRSIYKLPKNFIFLPNQFWSHKNHLVVVEALKKLQEWKTKAYVISTGSLFNPKNPKLINEIKRRIHQYQLHDQFRILGSVPSAHIVGLMRSCSFYINPSKHEGWSTSVEEAKVFSTPMILSDIPIHREQAEKGTRFFPADDAVFLADLIREKMIDTHGIELIRSPRHDFETEAKVYAEKLYLIIQEAFNGVKM